MIPCSATFDGKNTYEENGRIHYRWYYLEFSGNYTLTFRFISTNSPLPQGVSLFVSGDFKGKMYLNGRELRPLKSTFAHYTFRVDEFPENKFTLRVCSTAGKIFLANTSQLHNSDSWDCAVYGYALWVEELSENHYRFHCNDVDLDDDYDDLIFDIIAEMNQFIVDSVAEQGYIKGMAGFCVLLPAFFRANHPSDAQNKIYLFGRINQKA